MKRVIKFRAQDIASNKWLYGDIRHHKNDVSIFEQGGNRGEQVKPDTVGQFIGLSDKNGKEIYEGDIVKICYDLTCYFNGLCFVGVFNAQFALFSCHGKKLVGYFRGDAPRREVIGNIYDNPELIK